LTVFSSRDLIGLFHPTGTHGVSSPIGQRAQPVRARRLAGYQLRPAWTSKLDRAVRCRWPLLRPRPLRQRGCFQLLEPRSTAGLSPKDVRSSLAAGCRQPLHLLGQLQTAEAIRGRPRDAVSRPTPRRTEARSRNVNRQPATPASSIDPVSPKRPRHRPRWSAPKPPPANRETVCERGVRAKAPPRLSPQPRATEAAMGSVGSCGPRDHTVANHSAAPRRGYRVPLPLPLLGQLQATEVAAASTWVPARLPTPDEPETVAETRSRGAALPLLGQLQATEATAASTWVPG
jgi:hypothetical protein